MSKHRRGPPANRTHQQQPVALSHTQTKAFQGPIPSPDMLREYDLISPGFAQRIVVMAENEQSHRHDLEKTLNNANIEIAHKNASQIQRGQWMAFFIACFGLCISAYLVTLGHVVTGSIFGGALLVALVTAFLYQHSKQPDSKN